MSFKGNSVVLVEKDVYTWHIEKILDNATKFEKVNTEKRILNFSIDHETHIKKYKNDQYMISIKNQINLK